MSTPRNCKAVAKTPTVGGFWRIALLSVLNTEQKNEAGFCAGEALRFRVRNERALLTERSEALQTVNLM
jgi:predicted Rdx family selenoprotein